MSWGPGGSGAGWSGGAAEPPGQAPEAPPERYALGALLGVGGMARVYLGRDAQLDREVAVKIAGDPEVHARLVREARLTAALDHPVIVTVHDSGVTPAGEPFYTMRVVRGKTLDRALKERPTLAARLGLMRHFLDLCNAIAYAHDRGVLHRDLKPANVMIGEYGETQLMDWGLARRLDEAPDAPAAPRGPTDRTLTAAHAVLGTPAYLAPEQARGDAVDRRTDVWGLGAILCELLTGAPPWDGPDPLALLTRAAAGARLDLRGRAPDAPPELLAIAEAALALRPADRYPDAAALAGDVASWMDGRRVSVHAYSPWELASRLLVAWRLPLGLVASLAVILVTAGVTIQVRTERARVVAEAAQRDAEGNFGRALIRQARAAVDDEQWQLAEYLAAQGLIRGESAEGRGVLAAVSASARLTLEERWPLPTCLRSTVGRGQVLCFEQERTTLFEHGEARRTWPMMSGGLIGEDLYLRDHDDILRIPADGAEVRIHHPRGALDRDGGGGVMLWDPGTPALIRKDRVLDLPNCAPGRLLATSATADLTAMLCSDAYVQLVWEDRLVRRRFEVLDQPVTLGITPDSARLAVGYAGGLVLLYDIDGRELSRVRIGTTTWLSAQFSPDGQRVLLLGGDRAAVWDTVTGGTTFLPDGAIRDATWAGSDRVEVTGARFARWRIDSLPTSRWETPGGIANFANTPDLSLFASGDGTGEVALFRRDRALPLWRRNHQGVVKTITFDAANRVVAGGFFGIRRYGLDGGLLDELYVPTRSLTAVGDVLYLAPYDLWAGVVDFSGTPGPSIAPLYGLPHQIGRTIAAPPDGSCLMYGADQGGIWFTKDLKSRRMFEFKSEEYPNKIDILPGCRRIVSVGYLGSHVYDDAGNLLLSLPPGDTSADSVAMTDSLLAIGLRSGIIEVRDLETGALRASIPAHHDRISDLAFSADGVWLMSASWDRTLRIWDLSSLSTDPRLLLDAAAQRTGLDLEAVLGP